ncbi:MAG: AmpG family muropeptide MFS transporter [Candidatus Adiutrix sp.]|jgi:PAT family beta-lactamase induction signal transducer AmpG|nr:AmpG family muropeptide MFS transporter [Candidatus Adiutrix sp.]
MSGGSAQRGLRLIFRRGLISSFCMGFTSGVPLMVGLTLVQGWLTEAGVDLKAIGALALTGLPYSLKFLWAPWLDYYSPPLAGILGRRRGWIAVSQFGVAMGLLALAAVEPRNLTAIAVAVLFTSFASATQDAVVDAYRRDDLPDEELGVGSAYYVWGYRLGTMIVSGGGLILAARLGWPSVFRCVALLMLAGPLTLLFSPEPTVERPPAPAGLVNTLVVPLKDFFQRPAPILILSFIFFYKFGDQLATSLGTAFYIKRGYTTTEIGLLVKGFGVWATLAGAMLGGWAVLKYGVRRCLWVFGFYQMVTILGFAALCYMPVHPLSLGLVVSQENFSAGAGTSAFIAFMTAQTNRNFSATQYALLSALMALPRTVLSAPAGVLAEWLGWPGFFFLSTALALPAFFILYSLCKRGVFSHEHS